MAHFAKLENNIVVNTIVIDDLDCSGGVFPESESVGKLFISSLGLDGDWLQTGDGIRKQYGYVGCTYDSDADAFIVPKPFSSWILDSNNDWQPPTPQPNEDYYWDEESLSWQPIV